MNRKWRVVPLLMLAFVAACKPESSAKNDEGPPTAAAATSTRGATLRVALLHPGRENDHGWNELAVTALQSLAQRDGVVTKHVFSPNASNIKNDLRALADQHFDIVICHGGEFAKSAHAVAPDFPATHFVVTGSDEAGDGVATLDFRLWEATYLCGILAAKLVPDGPAGLIGAQDVRTVRRTLDAFANGARSVRRDYTVRTQYVGSWDDVAKAGQTARSLIDGYKVKVLFQNCDAAAFGVFQAARDSKIIAFGCNSDQSTAAPEIVPASATINMGEAFHQLVAKVREGKFEGVAIAHDLKSGGVEFVPNSKLTASWPADADKLIQNAKERIIAGQVDVLKNTDSP